MDARDTQVQPAGGTVAGTRSGKLPTKFAVTSHHTIVMQRKIWMPREDSNLN
jgi:hypothetical protein